MNTTTIANIVHCSFCWGRLPDSWDWFIGWRFCPFCGSKLVSRAHPLYEEEVKI